MFLRQRPVSLEQRVKDSLKPGMYLYGYCGGVFGRESYGDKKILSIGDEHITVEELGIVKHSTPIKSWQQLVTNSNTALDEDNG